MNRPRRRMLRNELNYRDRGKGGRPYFYASLKDMDTATLRREYRSLLAEEGMVST